MHISEMSTNGKKSFSDYLSLRGLYEDFKNLWKPSPIKEIKKNTKLCLNHFPMTPIFLSDYSENSEERLYNV